MKKLIAGMDLDSNNVVIGLMDMEGKRVAHQKVECKLSQVLKFLAPYKKRLEQIGVESTYNWYWLVDGLQAEKYPVVLANPAGMVQYKGIKHADDTNDAFFVAELLRLKILPTGYIYDAPLRPVRDFLRRPECKSSISTSSPRASRRLRKWCWPLRGSCRTIPSWRRFQGWAGF